MGIILELTAEIHICMAVSKYPEKIGNHTGVIVIKQAIPNPVIGQVVSRFEFVFAAIRKRVLMRIQNSLPQHIEVVPERFRGNEVITRNIGT